ncbi:nuclear transport factor 2 family protein [Elongatibacter sediminis]|uniref:Nuclear transport factor 2 family protein n=1 Tax=Elongatibacter sediminis TaxID=3119006 RepID=A0AAW9RB94_9GAMM
MGKAYDAVQRYIDSMKAKDLEATLDCFTDDCIYYLHVGTRPFIGKDYMRKGITILWPHQVASRWRIVNYVEDDNKIIFEGIDEYDQPDGTTVKMPYMGIYQIKDGRIWRGRDYFDMKGYLDMTKGDSNQYLLDVADTMHEQP